MTKFPVPFRCPCFSTRIRCQRSPLSTQRALSVQRAVSRVEINNTRHQLIVFMTPLEAALVLHDASRPFSALSYCVMNDSAHFSAAPATDETRK